MPEAVNLLNEYRVSALMGEDGVFQCTTFTQEGSFLHFSPVYPRDKVLFPETAPPEVFEEGQAEIMLPLHFVLYISSYVEEKRVGFSGKKQDSDKGEKASH